MFLEWGRPPPKMAGSVTSEAVAKAVVDAVERSRDEVVITKGLVKVDWFQAIMPEASGKMMRRSGMVGYFQEQALIDAEKNAR